MHREPYFNYDDEDDVMHVFIDSDLNLPRLKSRDSCFIDQDSSKRLSRVSTGLTSRSSYGTKYLYDANLSRTLFPSINIFTAALISRSWIAPHSGHFHSLTDRSFVSGFLYPQHEQI